MKKITTLFIVVFLLLTHIQPTYATNIPELDIEATAYIIMDAKSGQVLYGKNIHDKVFPASTTKIMTINIALKYGDVNQVLTANDFDVTLEEGASSMLLIPGEQITLDDALYAAGIPSANDACNMIARSVGGTYENFLDLMNQEAIAAGAISTHFNNPHGLHEDNHYTTPYDLSLIMKSALKTENFTKYLSTIHHTIPETEQSYERVLESHNVLLKPELPTYVEGIQATKTGFTDQAQYTLISYASKGDKDIIVAVFNSPDSETDFIDSYSLFNFAFNNYEYLSTHQIYTEVPTVTLPKNYHFLSRNFYRSDTPESILTHKDILKYPVSSTITFDDFDMNTKKGDIIGKIEYKQADITLSSMPVYLNTTIFVLSMKDVIIYILMALFVLLIAFILIIFSMRYLVRRKRRKKRERFKY